jgi:hypothetical protein
VKILANFPEFVETFYSNGLYPIISKIFRFTLGWLPFSFGDLFYLFLIVFILRWIFKNIKFIWKQPKATLLKIVAFFSVFYFMFHFLWGLNYHRLPLHQSLGLAAKYSTEDLVQVTKILINKSNNSHIKITKNDTLPVRVPYSLNELFDKTSNGYEQLSKEFPTLSYTPSSIKTSLFSLPLSYMGFSGYFNPFTGEAQVNSKIPKYKFAFVSCHEEAHQLGFSAENETNFIGALAAMNNDDPYFQYSGYSLALRYCLNELYRRDQDQFKLLIAQVNLGIKKNYRESSTFWSNYENPLEPLFKKSFDTFLKANNQKGGIESYSYVVALLVNYNKKNMH